ncbi:tyrosinase family protein [Ideonella sp. A 288]|uniref:tyrosinase family protein n=1 Tax=Ideonella sp. A 288 TaxID=1962181 RepID=UPI001303AEFA|nr:tyrosinase family protein [Ideonella sp. A 288]
MTVIDEGRRAVLALLAKGATATAAGAALATLGGCESLLEQIRNRPMRRDWARLGASDPVKDCYRAAVAAMKALPASDPRHWTKQATIHLDWCPHGNWWFLPWHRGYLLYFEQICRELTGDNTFALPYWNWTCQRSLQPEFLVASASNTLFDATRNSGVNPPPPMSDFNVGPAVMSAILAETNFLIFGSGKVLGQRDRTTQGPLESNPHNSVHGTVGGSGNFGSFMSPLDPIFWLHHGMVERVWWEWNVVRGHANTNDPAWANMRFDNQFVDRSGAPVQTSVGLLNLAPLLSYRYDTSPFDRCGIPLGDRLEVDKAVLRRLLEEGGRAELETVRRVGASRPTELAVGDRATEVLRVRDPAVSANATLGPDDRVLLRLTELEQPATGDFFVRVFVNLPGASAATGVDDPHYAGSFAFFNDPNAHHGGHVHGNAAVMVDATEAVRRLRRLGEIGADGELSVQLIATPFGGRPPRQARLAIGQVELQLARSRAPAPLFMPKGPAQ